MIHSPIRKLLSCVLGPRWVGIPLALTLLVACSFSRTGLDHSVPDSFVQEFRGQAVWTPPGSDAALTGELVLLLQADPDLGEVCFSSGPVVFFIYRRTARGWTLRFPTRSGRDRAGRKEAPNHLQSALIAAWGGGISNLDWDLQRQPNGTFVFSNSKTREKLAGILEPK